MYLDGGQEKSCGKAKKIPINILEFTISVFFLILSQK